MEKEQMLQLTMLQGVQYHNICRYFRIWIGYLS